MVGTPRQITYYQIKRNETGSARGAMEEWRDAYRIWLDNPDGKYHMEGIGVDERAILKWILRKMEWDAGEVDCSDSGQG